jgi:hypothetical protein
VLYGCLVCVCLIPFTHDNTEAGNGKYTKEERIFLLVSYLRLVADYTTIFADFQARFPNRPVPSRHNVTKFSNVK